MFQKELKELRVAIDANIKLAESHQDTIVVEGARELAIVRTKLQEAKMWVGKVMEANNSPLPQEFRDEAVAKDEPAA